MESVAQRIKYVKNELTEVVEGFPKRTEDSHKYVRDKVNQRETEMVGRLNAAFAQEVANLHHGFTWALAGAVGGMPDYFFWGGSEDCIDDGPDYRGGFLSYIHNCWASCKESFDCPKYRVKRR